MVHFQTNFEKIPLAPPPAAPPGRCRALGRGYFSDYFEKALHFSEIFENRQSHIFKLAQMQLFQDFNNYRGTQDARKAGGREYTKRKTRMMVKK